MTSMTRRRTGSALVVSLMLLSVAMTGCNIFSWTHDEGSSGNSDTLVQDARDALLDGKFKEALEFAKKGIQNDPAPMKEPELRWIAASAVLSDAGVNLSALMSSLSNPNQSNKSAPGGASPHIAEPYQILNLSTEELLALAQSCPQAVIFLKEVLDALNAGEITPQDIIGFQFDIELGFSIAQLMTAFLTALDQDQNLDNGFVQNPDVKIYADTNPSGDGGYSFEYTGPGDTEQFIRCTLVRPLWSLYCEALIGLNAAYASAIAPATWGTYDDINNCNENMVTDLPGTPDDTYIIGQVLDFAHKGIQYLFTQYMQTPCTP